ARHPVPAAGVVQPAVHQHQRRFSITPVIPELKFQTIGIEEVGDRFHGRSSLWHSRPRLCFFSRAGRRHHITGFTCVQKNSPESHLRRPSCSPRTTSRARSSGPRGAAPAPSTGAETPHRATTPWSAVLRLLTCSS